MLHMHMGVSLVPQLEDTSNRGHGLSSPPLFTLNEGSEGKNVPSLFAGTSLHVVCTRMDIFPDIPVTASLFRCHACFLFH